METTIKFRWIDKVTKEYIDIEHLYLDSKWNVVSMVDNNRNHYNTDDVHLSQYIRKNDRMNREIYVWDIVKNWFAWVRIVQECSWWFSLLWLDWEYRDSIYNISALNSECMVFGNIYKNPEIIEEYNKIPKTKYDTDYLFPKKTNDNNSRN